ncbi:MAG: electron transfer flavoprotein subunit alpha/FixB family protein, partial [Firmicutes bacterium]|nr:electron transfer flavoprotein subunit alpha/FixB family protein [Bacillota bacterium]
GSLEISSACRLCKLCVRKGPAGVIEYAEDPVSASIDKSAWKGIAVYADVTLSPSGQAQIHPVTFELLGKARELSRVTSQEVMALMIAPKDAPRLADELLCYGADQVYLYESEAFTHFSNTTFASAFEDFIEKVRPSSVLVGATNIGRSLAPRVAAHFKTGLTADCTRLEMKENTDLVQIRPAFGGNIMAQIITARTRPQFATVRYKIFQAPEKRPLPEDAALRIHVMETDPSWEDKRIRITKVTSLPPIKDISEAERIVAVGRGLKSPDDLQMARTLANKLGAHLACTRPLVEAGWLDASHQIGLSGKTVKPKLIITLGVSGSVQFAAGMNGSECIVAVNTDPQAPIFDIAHYCVVGDLYEVADELIRLFSSKNESETSGGEA